MTYDLKEPKFYSTANLLAAAVNFIYIAGMVMGVSDFVFMLACLLVYWRLII